MDTHPPVGNVPVTSTALRVMAAGALTFAAATAAAAPALAPHEATYALSLHESARGFEVSALRGRMQMRFEASCDGWRLEQALAFHMLSAEGDAGLEHLAHFNAFEEARGTGFTFNSRTWEDRELVEQLSGTARRRSDSTVEVKHVEPQARDEVLPPGTLFPTEHVHAVLAAAHAGKRFALHTVFDGSSAESPYEISSVIGDPLRQPPPLPGESARRRVWPVRLAYFGIEAVEPDAEFEMSVMLFANGVAGNMVYDYGDFAIDVTLESVTLLPPPTCR